MKACDIINLLKQKHAEDVFVTQCKTGRSWGDKFHIFDGYALKRSWANQLTIGYEVKVARGDFLSDDKWHEYLPYCHEFYFVSPYQLIKPEELPAEAGLIWAAQNGSRLFTKKKAPRRNISIPIDILYYIIICRSVLKAEVPGRKLTLDMCKDWLSNKIESDVIGHMMEYKIAELVGRRVKDVLEDNEKLHHENDQLSQIKELADKLGLDYTSRYMWNAEDRIKNAISKVPRELLSEIIGLKQSMERTIRSCDDLLKQLDPDKENST